LITVSFFNPSLPFLNESEQQHFHYDKFIKLRQNRRNCTTATAMKTLLT